jgi:leucyl-tRNA synthetase
VAPFAPHITDELWQQLGHETSVHADTWPKWDEKLLVKDTLTIVVQVNGRVRANIRVPTGAGQDDVIKAARADGNVVKHLAGRAAKKVVYVPDKLINFVL